jgi:hypothetical protein
MKPRVKGVHRKNFGEHLGPLKNYLVRQVGRHWDKVYSEICANMDRSNTVQAHIFQHLYDYIAVNCYWKDGVLYDAGIATESQHAPVPVGTRYRRASRLYVCPKSGMIRRLKPRHRQREVKELTYVEVSDFLRFRKHRGVWQREVHAFKDHLEKKWDPDLGKYIVINHGPRLMLQISNQANKKDLRQHSLVNEDWAPIIDDLIRAWVPSMDHYKANQFMRGQTSLKNQISPWSRFKPDGLPGMIERFVPKGRQAAALKAARPWT